MISRYLSLKLSINIDTQIKKKKVIHVKTARSLYLSLLAVLDIYNAESASGRNKKKRHRGVLREKRYTFKEKYNHIRVYGHLEN